MNNGRQKKKRIHKHDTSYFFFFYCTRTQTIFTSFDSKINRLLCNKHNNDFIQLISRRNIRFLLNHHSDLYVILSNGVLSISKRFASAVSTNRENNNIFYWRSMKNCSILITTLHEIIERINVDAAAAAVVVDVIVDLFLTHFTSHLRELIVAVSR